MGEIIGNVSGDEGMEETMKMKPEQDVINILHTYFPNEPVENLIRFWSDIKNTVTDYLKNCSGNEV